MSILEQSLKIGLAREAAKTERIRRTKVRDGQLSTLSARWKVRKRELEEKILLTKPRHLEARAKLEDEYQVSIRKHEERATTVRTRQRKDLEDIDIKHAKALDTAREAYGVAEADLQAEQQRVDEWWKQITGGQPQHSSPEAMGASDVIKLENTVKAVVTVAGTSDQTVQAFVEGIDTASAGQDSPPHVCDRSPRGPLISMVTMCVVAEGRGELYKSVEASRGMEELGAEMTVELKVDCSRRGFKRQAGHELVDMNASDPVSVEDTLNFNAQY